MGTANTISHPRAAMSRRSQRHRPPHLRKARAQAVTHSNPIHLHATRSQPGLCADTRASVPSSTWTCSVSFCTSCSFEYMIRDMTSAFFPSQHPPPFYFLWSGNASPCEYLIENEWEICKFLKTPTNFLMISCHSSMDGPLQLQEAWAAEYSNHIVPASEKWGCFTRLMPTLPGAGQAHNHCSLTE